MPQDAPPGAALGGLLPHTRRPLVQVVFLFYWSVLMYSTRCTSLLPTDYWQHERVARCATRLPLSATHPPSHHHAFLLVSEAGRRAKPCLTSTSSTPTGEPPHVLTVGRCGGLATTLAFCARAACPALLLRPIHHPAPPCTPVLNACWLPPAACLPALQEPERRQLAVAVGLRLLLPVLPRLQPHLVSLSTDSVCY